MTIKDFLDWWRSQLLELVPASWYGFWQRARTTITLRVGRDRAALVGPAGDTLADCPTPATNDPNPSTELKDYLMNLPTPPQRLRLILEPGQFLVHRFTMPRAAKGHLAEAVGYQLPKLTPFTVDQVLYACGIGADSSPDGPLPVWLVAIPRQRLVSALALIDQAPPPNPLPLSVAPEPGQALEVAWGIAESSRSTRRYLKFAWVAMLTLWVGALSLHLYKRHDALDQLDQMLSGLRTEAAKVSQLRQRLDDSVQRLEWLGERKRLTASTLVLLDSLAQLLDDQTWLQRLDFDGKDLTLTGISSAPSALVETLETSSSFEGVRFDAFTQDRRNEGNRFNLSAKVEQPASAGGS
jgi:general secretion pathway protein L